MSSSVHHIVTRSRCDSLGDREVTEEDLSIYATPRPETPYETPSSTPRLIHCRLNPVKTIRQHVPLKINFSHDTENTAPDQAALSKFNQIKPMNTKKVRCVIQPNPLYRDGDGDQGEAGDATYSKDCHLQVPGELCSDDNSRRVSVHRHSRGDGEIIQAAQPAASAIICNDDNQLVDNFQSAAVIEKEILMMDTFVKNSIKRLQNCCDDQTNGADYCDAMPTSTDHHDADNHKTCEKTKNDKVAGKTVSLRKNSCVQENHDGTGATHKCEKKKFYDPKDIRKYMMKKKNERQAKEKEERHKKETEAMALRRKAEASKMFTKTRIPVPRSHHTHEYENENKFKNVPKTKIESTCCSKPVEESKPITNQASNDENVERCRRYSKNLPEKYDNRKSISEQVKLSNGSDEISGHEYFKTLGEISNTENFTKKFNEIITKCAEEAVNMTLQGHKSAEKAGRISNKIKPPQNISKHSPLRIENATSLPEELDVLKSKNPYNFLNILKGKVNLAKNSEDVAFNDIHDDHLLANAFALSPPKKSKLSKSDKNAFLENIIERRLKLGNSIPLAMKLNELKSSEEYENVEPVMTLRSELTLDDLHLSPPKPDQTYLVNAAKKSDKTFTLDKDINDISSKNTATSLELSGIKLLSGVDEKKDVEVRDGGGSLEFAEKLGCLSRTLSLESLKAHNVSLSLPDSFIGKQGKENCDLSMRNLSMDFRKLMEDESIFGKGITKASNKTSSLISKLEEKTSDPDAQKSLSNESSAFSSDTIANLSTTAVFFDIYDQMIKSEDEKLTQILHKIHQQKEALNKYLKTEVYALESRKKMYRENGDDLDMLKTMKMKILKQRQRAILLKITKNIQELDKMKKSVIETVERRKAEILRQKNALIEKKEAIKQKISSSKKKKSDNSSKTFLVSKQTNTLFMGLSSSSSTSIFVENGENLTEENVKQDELEEYVDKEETDDEKDFAKFRGVKDTATSPVHFNSGISIRLELDPEKLLKIKSPRNEIKIDATKLAEDEKINSFRPIHPALSESEDNVGQIKEPKKIEDKSKMIKIKRPLSPVVFPTSKKVSQMRRLSSSSDVTFASLNDTTTDQSDVELRISALQEQLRQRKLEAERLRREEKQIRKEKLRAKEQSLLKQLEAYDQYIQRVTKMLSEDKSLIEVAKPQIKQTSKRSSFSEVTDKKFAPVDFTETPQHEEDISTTKIKNYVDDVDAETNTEDSEKHLRKADSGILMESEVTEVSDNIDVRKSKSESEMHSEGKSERETDNVKSEVKSADNKSVDNFLQLINDIRSEVVSMSEQVYSSDFVEDIPEDLPESKSESSNDLNTSVSIEEIVSDQHDNSGTESKPESIKEIAKVVENIVSNVEVSQPTSPVSEPTSIHIKEIETEKSNSDVGLFVVKNISDIESLTSNAAVITAPSPLEEPQVKDSIDEDSIKEELKSISSPKGIKQSFVDEVEATTSIRNIISESLPLDEIKSAGSLETPMTEIKESSMFFDYSGENNTNDAANTESIVNHEFVKYESEGSSVADVDEPVRKVDDIETMMDGFRSNDFTLTDENVSEKAQKNFEEVLKNLESYFSMKISPVEIENTEIKSSQHTNIQKADFTDPIEMEAKPLDNQAPLVKPVEVGPEETDISESLEYDTTSAENSDPRYQIEFTISEKKLNQVTDLDDDDKIEPTVEEPDSEKSKIVENAGKKSNEEFSAEEDRSVEEFLEDYSIPNLAATTFIVNEDDSQSEANASVEIRTLTPSPVPSSPEVRSETSSQGRDDLDQKISMDQTPFLQALRRESESMFGKNSESHDSVTPEMLDKLVEKGLTEVVDEIAKNVEIDRLEEAKVSNAINEADSSKTNAKVDESFLGKHVGTFDNDWFDKELSFNQERLREAEELRLQQIRIEQEIEELQAQQHIPPYLYIREIPNKPPPPYTPPSEHNALKIPNNENELRTLTGPAIQYVCNSLKKGLKIDDIKLLPEYASAGKSNTEVTSYKKFIFHLTKQVARSILESSKTKKCLPWENLSKNNIPKIPPSEEDLPKIIENEILILFGFKSKINKEKLIIQWSRKKRNDFVDDLLIKELQEEEAEWTNYEEDENIIKNQITQNLLDDLIQDTVNSLNDAFSVKNKLTSQ